MDIEALFIAILFCLVIFYIAYKAFVFLAKKITNKDYKQEIFSGELKKEGAKFSFRIKQWFSWNVTVNNEKGTAGGNIKINFPLPIAGFICIAIAILVSVFPITSWLIPFIFLCFSIYYFRKWLSSIKAIKRVSDAVFGKDNGFTAQRLIRCSTGKYVAGVCKGINIRYGVPVVLVRGLFIITLWLGLFIYLLCWYFIPLTVAQEHVVR